MSKNKTDWLKSLTKWEYVRFTIAMKIAGDVIINMVGTAIAPYVLKEGNE